MSPMSEFREQQQVHVWCVPPLLLAGVAWVAIMAPSLFHSDLVNHHASDSLAWSIPAVGIGLPVLVFLVMKLTVAVDEDGVHIRYRPFVRRKIPFDEIQSFRVRRFRPIREFGGWGIRRAPGRRRAYTVTGDRGVELYLADGSSLMLGSRRPDELAAALRGYADPATTP